APVPRSSSCRCRASSARLSSVFTTATRFRVSSFDRSIHSVTGKDATMEVGKLNAEFRNDTGKSAVRRLRAAGKIPAICYGNGGDPLPLTVDPSALLKSLDPVKKTNTVLTLSVTGAPAGQESLTVMVREYQKDAIKGNVTHADFI